MNDGNTNEKNKTTGDDATGYSRNVASGRFEHRREPGQQLQHQRIGDHVPTLGHTSEARASEGLQVGGAMNRIAPFLSRGTTASSQRKDQKD